jgi:lipopolysaccharide export system ATP-binding protein
VTVVERDSPAADVEIPSEGLFVDKIGKAFRGRQVVKDVSLSLKRGEVVGLLGPNGAGKTTSFYMITGLIPADTGRIFLDGLDITAQPMFQRARMGLGYLPQETSIFRGMTVRENVMAVAELREKKKAAAQKKVAELLEELHITHLADSPASALSGGERRRVEIARALASDPAFILLDEPFAGIDPLAISDIREVINFLKSRGLGVLITDHNVRETRARDPRHHRPRPDHQLGRTAVRGHGGGGAGQSRGQARLSRRPFRGVSRSPTANTLCHPGFGFAAPG